MIIEACIENYMEGKIAQNKNAHRLEICENLHVGGTTPSYGSIKLCLEKLDIPTIIMIRPRGGNFVYSNEEIEQMLIEIEVCKNLNAYGVTFGCLNKDNTINYKQMETLLKASKNMKIIMHRAFDELNNPWEQIEKLAKLGVDSILSAGGKTTFFDGLETLKRTQKECQKHNIKLTAAGKITQENLAQCLKLLSPNAFHGRAIVGKY